jgi:hypothetical protein
MLTFTIFFVKTLHFLNRWAESLRSALFDEQSGRAERPLACKNLGANIIVR